MACAPAIDQAWELCSSVSTSPFAEPPNADPTTAGRINHPLDYRKDLPIFLASVSGGVLRLRAPACAAASSAVEPSEQRLQPGRLDVQPEARFGPRQKTA